MRYVWQFSNNSSVKRQGKTRMTSYEAIVGPAGYRNRESSFFSGTCWLRLLPKLGALLLFGYMFAPLVTEIMIPLPFRAHVAFPCDSVFLQSELREH